LEGSASPRRPDNHGSASRIGDTGIALPLANFENPPYPQLDE
jgi:hypothetical protein